MRYSEIKLVEQKLFEANRGIIGTVIDTQGGRGISFTTPDGTVVRATNAWKFPIDEKQRRYSPSTAALSPGYIKQLQVKFNNTQKLDAALQGEIDQTIENSTLDALQQIATSNINFLSDAAKQELESRNISVSAQDPEQQFAAELQKETGMNVDTVKWVGGQKPSTGFAALVVELRVGEKTSEWVGKYYASKQADGHIFWKVSDFEKEVSKVGIELEQKRAAGSTGTAGNVNFGPLNVGITDRVISINNLITEVQRGVQDKIAPEDQNTLVELLENLGGAQTTINPEYKANYEVQFGEVAAPLAIARGINVTGSIQAAEEKLLGLLDPGTKFTGISQVEFPENIAEKLVDSYLITPNGSRVGISSKDKKGGAAASISSIIETINTKLDVIKERVPDFETRYAKYISRLRVIENSTGKTVAFNLAADMGIISEQTAKQALDLMLTDPGNEEALRAIGNGGYYELTINYDGYTPKTEHPMYKISYHAASSLARIAAAEFNRDKEQTYRFFATVLESSNMIQVMTTLSAKGDQAAFTKFNVIYPPVFDGDIKLDPSSYFTAQKPPAGYTFKIK
jgi:hypothetical protein